MRGITLLTIQYLHHYTLKIIICNIAEDEESGKDWSDLEREAAEEDKKDRNGDPIDYDRKRKNNRDRRDYDSDGGRGKKGKSLHNKSSSNHKSSSSNHKSSSSNHKSSSSNHKSSSHKSPSKHNSSSR